MGEHVPLPTAIPFADAHCGAVARTQESNAPSAEDRTQHWIAGSGRVVVVEVVVGAVAVVVVVVVAVGRVVVVVVVDRVVGGQGFGVQVPPPTSMPFADTHCAALETTHESKAPSGDDCTQHWVVGSVVVVLLVGIVVVVEPAFVNVTS